MIIHRLHGLTPFSLGLEKQQHFLSLHATDAERDDDLILAEHEPVYTIGRTKNHSSLGNATQLPHPVFEIHRGGQATYHGPGQLTVYPIINLNRRKRDIHAYVTCLEHAIIDTCRHFGIKAQQKEGLTGVWVGNRKLASIGIGVHQWITMHGFALNITQEALPPFGNITPCGINGVQMTCLHSEGACRSLHEVTDSIIASLSERIDAELPLHP